MIRNRSTNFPTFLSNQK